jgi:hypothetical protein
MAGCIIVNNNAMGKYVNDLFGMIQSGKVSDDDRVQATLCLGEIGVSLDLAQKCKNIIDVIANLFQNQNDQIRQAASICLGSISIGNTKFFLDQVF